jgi:wyosine [tRNA(Phe)-imidazoG37] synthetase (radical SAM superfamily)
VPLADVVDELEKSLSSQPDYITLSGSGEPTLHSRVGELIAHIKNITRIPVAVLTNGSLMWQEDVRQQLLGADLVIPSLDAGDETMFRIVNRPHAGISFEQMLAGLIAFRRQFRGQYWLEVFVLASYSVPANWCFHRTACRLHILHGLDRPSQISPYVGRLKSSS